LDFHYSEQPDQTHLIMELRNLILCL